MRWRYPGASEGKNRSLCCELAAERPLKFFIEAGRLEKVDIARSRRSGCCTFCCTSTATNRQADPRPADVQMPLQPQTRRIGAFYSSPP